MSVRRLAISVLGPGEFAKKRICVECDKVACAICGEKTASSSAIGFIRTDRIEERYTPFGIKPWIQTPALLIPTIQLPTDKLLYYCPACVAKYGEAGLATVVNERYRKKHKIRDESHDYWDPDD